MRVMGTITRNSLREHTKDRFIVVILIAEDDLTLGHALQDVLTNAGHDVVLVANGKEALKASEYVDTDLVLLDMLMSEMDGLEAIMQLRVRFPEKRIIAMWNGYYFGKFDVLDIAKKLGASSILVKPFSIDVLLEAIHQ
jgi:CheY-like chemotaxis protein